MCGQDVLQSWERDTSVTMAMMCRHSGRKFREQVGRNTSAVDIGKSCSFLLQELTAWRSSGTKSSSPATNHGNFRLVESLHS